MRGSTQSSRGRRGTRAPCRPAHKAALAQQPGNHEDCQPGLHLPRRPSISGWSLPATPSGRMRWKGQRSRITYAAVKLAASNPLILKEATADQAAAAGTSVRNNTLRGRSATRRPGCPNATGAQSSLSLDQELARHFMNHCLPSVIFSSKLTSHTAKSNGM